MIPIEKAVHARLVREGLERANSSTDSQITEDVQDEEGRLTRAGRCCSLTFVCICTSQTVCQHAATLVCSKASDISPGVCRMLQCVAVSPCRLVSLVMGSMTWQSTLPMILGSSAHGKIVATVQNHRAIGVSYCSGPRAALDARWRPQTSAAAHEPRRCCLHCQCRRLLTPFGVSAQHHCTPQHNAPVFSRSL